MRLRFSLFVSVLLALSIIPHGSFAGLKEEAMRKIEDVEGLPRVLLIGDSISIGYTGYTRAALKGVANVHRPLTNCGPTSNGVAKIEEWLETGGADKRWDVIHFNWGLHDLKYVDAAGKIVDPAAPGAARQIPPDEYRENLTALTKRLKETGATLIWRNTTPVPKGSKGRVAGDATVYNAIAVEIMDDEGVATQDLFTFVIENPTMQLPANVHFSPEGSAALAEEVAEAIRKTLSE